MQQNLKENLPSKHIYIHMGFAEVYRCRSQGELQSAYWSQTQVTINPAAAYFKREEKLCHQPFVFLSDEPWHDTKFIFTLLRSLVPQLTKLISELATFTTGLTRQLRNTAARRSLRSSRVITSTLHLLKLYGNRPRKRSMWPNSWDCKTKSWSGCKKMKKHPRRAGLLSVGKDNRMTSSIKLTFLSSENYENAASFLSQEQYRNCNWNSESTCCFSSWNK